MLILGKRIDLLNCCRNLLMDLHDLLREKTADLTVLLKNTFPAPIHTHKK